jgi:hypothetical protein
MSDNPNDIYEGVGGMLFGILVSIGFMFSCCGGCFIGF